MFRAKPLYVWDFILGGVCSGGMASQRLLWLHSQARTGRGSGQRVTADIEVRNHFGLCLSRTGALKRSWMNWRDFKGQNLPKFLVKWAWRAELKELSLSCHPWTWEPWPVIHPGPIARWLHWRSVNGTEESHAWVEGGSKQKHRTSLGLWRYGLDWQSEWLSFDGLNVLTWIFRHGEK